MKSNAAHIGFILIGGLVQASFAADYFVATNGSDSASGTLAEPFATIQYAVDNMSAGDTCYIRGGRYHEEVLLDQLTGDASNPLSFEAYNGETVTLDGTIPVAAPWIQHDGSIYKTTLDQQTWQLIVDDEWMVNARWPNANFNDGSIWDHDRYWAQYSGVSSNGYIVDAPHHDIDLAASGLDLSGAVLIMEERLRVRPILAHVPGTSSFTHEPLPNGLGTGLYYVEAKLELLDTENEWFFDTATSNLYLWAPAGGMPSGDIRCKVQDFAFYLDRCEYVNFTGINFYGTTAYSYRSKHIKFEDCDFRYPSCSKRMLGRQDGYRDRMYFSQLNQSQDSYCSLINCNFSRVDSEAVYMVGIGNRIENCSFTDIDPTGGPLEHGAYSVYMKGTSGVFRRNTAYGCGAGNFLYPGYIPTIETIELNHMDNVCLNGGDVGIFHLYIGFQENSDIGYNWLFDSDAIGVRFDAPIPPTSWGHDGLVHHNVGINLARGIMTKGEYHEVHNNTMYDSGGRDITVLDDPSTSWQGNVSRNNAAQELTGNRSGYAPPSGISDHNWNGYLESGLVKDLLRDPANLDFRPILGSALVDAGTNIAGITDGHVGSAPDIGAYESGSSNYWIPGRKLVRTSTPVPPNGAFGVKTDADLMWLGGYEATSHDIYFGTDPGSLVYQGNQSNNIFDPGALSTNTVYYWRVDAVTPSGTITGEVWSFTLGSPPVFITNPVSKQFSVTGQAYVESLVDDALDADGDAITFSKLSGPDWLSVAANGSLGGTPAITNLGLNQFTVRAADGVDGSSTATVHIEVVLAGSAVFSETAEAPSENLIASNLVGNGAWNSITVAKNDGVSDEHMYGQTFVHTNEFLLQSVSFTTGDSKSYGAGQMLELAILEDTNSDNVPDTVVGSVYSVPFESINGSKPWKTLSLVSPPTLDGNKKYGFVYTLIGPISNNLHLRVNTDSTKSYPGGPAITTSYTAGSFPNPLPPALNTGRDLVFAVQGIPSPGAYYADWAKGYSIAGQDGLLENPDGDALDSSPNRCRCARPGLYA